MWDDGVLAKIGFRRSYDVRYAEGADELKSSTSPDQRSAPLDFQDGKRYNKQGPVAGPFAESVMN